MTESLDETARRVRAARAYAGLSIQGLADGLGVGAQTIKRIEAGSRRARPFELWGIAKICGVPPEFFEVSFDAIEQTGLPALLNPIERRLEGIEARMDRILEGRT